MSNLKEKANNNKPKRSKTAKNPLKTTTKAITENQLATEETKKLYQKYYEAPNQLFISQLKTDTMNIYFSENIKRLRREHDLTQEAIADFLGISFQAVSKWERGESYPDIEMLPEIAVYFGISVDELLGVNRAQNEQEILSIIEEYDNLTDSEAKHKIIIKAIEKYPNDFRLQLRQMSDLAFRNAIANYKKNLPKVRAIYENIQRNCRTDTIRICAKRYLAAYYNMLAYHEESGITV